MARTRILGRIYRDQLAAHDRARVKRILADTPEQANRTRAGATAGGDERKLRGIPAIARGVSGVSPGTRPGDNLR